jgi:hypothetical protein
MISRIVVAHNDDFLVVLRGVGDSANGQVGDLLRVWQSTHNSEMRPVLLRQ